MLSDVRNHYGLARDFGQAGYFETEHFEQIVSELKLEIKAGKLVALSGIVGCGKTTMLRRIQEALSQDREILVSSTTLLSIFLLSYVIFSKMTCRGVGRPTLATQH
jgi:ABC-type glutathione transport system ATPase component